MSKGTILIVEDDFDLRDSLQDMLEDEGYHVATAADGAEALAYLRSRPAPGLVLLDWMMPTCDGRQFRTEQLADPALAHIPVVLLTADARVRDQMPSLGLSEFLGKPFRLEALLAVVARYCG